MTIRFKRSAEPNKVPSGNQLELGEIAINTHDGKLFFKREQGETTVVKEMGARDKADNVYYVTMNGDDNNDGRTIGDAFASLKKAVSVAEEGSTIYVKSGTHVVDNPILVPAYCAIVGDSLRTSIIKAGNPTQDIFHVRNGAFLKDLRITGHEAPAAGAAFPPNSGEVIYTSPYVQNCTSDTTTGTGLRIDGNDVEGLKSMVVDAYTQYNEGGIGIHHLNGGNTQLVSVFTICCDIAILCESGGFCSLTNSNSSFGNKGLVADGLSPELYSGTTGATIGDRQIIINDLKNIPYINNATKFSGSEFYYNVLDATPLQIGDGVIEGPLLSGQDSALQTARTTVLAERETIQRNTITYINNRYPTLDYNRSKCSRDVGLIVDSVLDDMVLNTNYRTVVAGRSYYRGTASLVIADQLTETIDAIQSVKAQVLDLLTPATDAYTRVAANFDIIVNIIQNGLSAVPAITFTNPDGLLPEVGRARDHLVNNRNYLIEEAVAAIAINFPLLGYDRDVCERDVGLVIDAISYDMIFDANFRSITAGLAYFREGAAVVIESQKLATIAAFTELKSLITSVLTDSTIIARAQALMDIIIGILDEDSTATTPAVSLTDPTGYNTTFLVGYGDARDNIEANRAFIEEQVIAFIDANFSSIIYVESDCRRDINYILDALRYDLTYGGNLETLIAGRAYYSAGVLQLGNNEEEATLAAYGYLSELVEQIALNNTVVSLQAIQTQVTGGLTPSSATAAEAAGSLVDDIITLIANDSSEPAAVAPDITWTSATFQSEFSTLQSEKSNLQSSITTFIEANFAYDTAKCKRDLGYIIDGVTYDILYRGNSQSYDVAIQYYSGGSLQVPVAQRDATGDAIRHLYDIISDVFRSNAVPRLQSDVTQNTTVASTTIAEIRRAETLFLVVESVVRRSYFINTFIEETFQDFASQPADAQAIRDIIYTNKEKLQIDTIEFINNNFSEFQYDEAICFRDVGLILDAVAMDVALGTNYNSVTAGLSYQRATLGINRVKQTQFAQTLNAIRFVKTEVLKLSLSATGVSRVTALFDEIIEIFEFNTPDAVTYPSPSPVDQNLVDAKDQLQGNKEFIKAEVIAWINNEFANFSFDQAKCERDLGYILDAVLLDAALDTNYNSLVAGESYYRANANLVLVDQKIQTLGALRFFRDLVDEIENITTTARIRIVDNIDFVINIIDTGNLTNDPEYINPLYATDEVVFTKNLLGVNRTFIQEEIVAYVNENYPGLSYDEAKCRRDVGFIVDALIFDVLYGGNTATVIAADSYFVGAVSQLGAGEATATADAYTHLKTVAEEVITGVLVDRSVGNTQTQVLLTDIGTATEVAAINALLDEYITVITDGNTDNLSAKVLPDITQTDLQFQVAFEEVNEERARLISSTLTFIQEEYQTFSYDQAKCARDVGFIIDALSYDILYGGNSATLQVAESYFSQFEFEDNVNQLGDGETEATIAAYNHLATIIRSIVQNISIVPTTGNNQSQNTGISPATLVEGNRLVFLISLINDTLELGTDNNIPDIDLPSISWVAAGLQTDFSTIGSAKPTIQQSTITFINDRYVNFNYNQFKCSRDVGLILEAVADDMALGTNYKSIVAGSSYYRASAARVIDDQLAETVEAIKYLKQETLALLQDYSSTLQSSEYVAVESRFDDILNILSNGLGSVPAIEYNAPSGATQSQQDAAVTLQANRDFFIEEGVAYISENFPLIGYDRATCERDVGLVIDALGYDLMFGSNFRSITAGRSYYREGAATVTADQKEATIASFTELKRLASDAVTDSTAKASIESNMDLIISILDTGLTAVPGSYTVPVPTSGTDNASDPGFLNARDNIEANRAFILEEVTQYIADNSNLVGDYDQAKCERDSGLILDAVALDLVTGSTYNSTYAGIAYTRANSSYVIEKQDAATLLAIEFLRDQVKALAGVDATADTQVDTLFAIITNAIQNGTTSVSEPGDGTIAALVFDTAITEPTVDAVEAHTRLRDNRSWLQTEVIEYIAANSPPAGYDQTRCERDVGYIVDGLSFDILYGGNVGSRLNALSYYVGTIAQLDPDGADADEVTATIAAYRHLGAILRELLAASAGTLTSQVQVTAPTYTVAAAVNNGGEDDILYVSAPEAGLLYEVIRVVVDGATTNLSAESQPASAQYTATNNASYTAARTAIITDKTALVAATINYINSNLKYDEAACRRDVGYLLDALFYDLTYGGNLETLVAGNAYYSGAVLQVKDNAQKEVTLAAYTYLETLVETIALDNDVTELQTGTAQVFTGNAGSADASTAAGDRVTEVRLLLDSDSSTVAEVLPDTTWVTTSLVTANTDLQAEKATIQAAITVFVEENFAYVEEICRRDIGFIIDALTYDVLYSGNSQMIDASDEYYSGGVLQITNKEIDATIRTYKYLREVAADVVANIQIAALQTVSSQNTGAAGAASADDIQRVNDLVKITVNLLEHGYSSTVTFDTRIRSVPKINETVSFYQASLITASGHTFEWVGSGVNINSALPYQGGQPIEANQVIETNNGKVYFTSTDQKGDFKIGPELTIERASGTITGEAFDRSLFAVLTPYILSLQ